MQLHDPPGTHHDLGCKVFLTLAISFFFVCFWNVHLTAAHKTVTPPLGSQEEMSLVMRLGLTHYVKHLLEELLSTLGDV